MSKSATEDTLEKLREAYASVQRQKQGDASLSLQPMWDIVNSVPMILRELRQAKAMRSAIEEHDRFNRDMLRYSGPDDPALDEACGEDWANLLAALKMESR